ncbi:MAG: hypothetical protein II960_04690 [Synergistaceae bacterium]|nr:hypothetical protein [Synergistaceae bacterium]
MKKVLAATLLIFMFSSLSYGAVSEDSSIYVRQDVFDAKTEALFERLHGEITTLSAKIDNNFEKLSAKIDSNFAVLSGRIDALSGRIDGMDYKIDVLQTVVYWGLGILSFLVASFVLAPIVGGIVQNLRKPSFTIDDVKKLISEAQLSRTPQI